jgi:hypothetical protein
LIFHSLQLPKCISPVGGNLSDFAAQVGLISLYWPHLQAQQETDFVLTMMGV